MMVLLHLEYVMRIIKRAVFGFFENGVPTLYLSGKEYSQKYPIKDGEIYKI